jgi:hypothetical protein
METDLLVRRVLVCGGRDFSSEKDRELLFDFLDQLKVTFGEILVISGGARGADTLAVEWAMSREQDYEVYLADWKKHGRGGGHIRNQRMLDEGRPDLVVAFPGGRGTADMTSRANAAGVSLMQVSRR